MGNTKEAMISNSYGCSEALFGINLHPPGPLITNSYLCAVHENDSDGNWPLQVSQMIEEFQIYTFGSHFADQGLVQHFLEERAHCK